MRNKTVKNYTKKNDKIIFIGKAQNKSHLTDVIDVSR